MLDIDGRFAALLDELTEATKEHKGKYLLADEYNGSVDLNGFLDNACMTHQLRAFDSKISDTVYFYNKGKLVAKTDMPTRRWRRGWQRIACSCLLLGSSMEVDQIFYVADSATVFNTDDLTVDLYDNTVTTPVMVVLAFQAESKVSVIGKNYVRLDDDSLRWFDADMNGALTRVINYDSVSRTVLPVQTEPQLELPYAFPANHSFHLLHHIIDVPFQSKDSLLNSPYGIAAAHAALGCQTTFDFEG